MTTDKLAFSTKEISASSRASIKVGDSFYTFEASETRTVNDQYLPSELNEKQEMLEKERAALFDTVNAQVDNQIAELLEYLRNKRKN